MERVRISDIAEELGLSTATVSNVIHGKTRKISDETVRRVQALLEERRAYWQREAARFRWATAAFAVSDAYAVELMQFLRACGLRVPEKLSVAGFDDTPWCKLVSPALTTVRQDSAQRARLAMEKLGELKAHADCGGTIVLPVQLVERDSTAPVWE